MPTRADSSLVFQPEYVSLLPGTCRNSLGEKYHGYWEDAVPMPHDDLLRCLFFCFVRSKCTKLNCAGMAITVISSVSPRVVRPTQAHEIFLSCYGTHVYFIPFKSYSCSITHRVATTYHVAMPSYPAEPSPSQPRPTDTSPHYQHYNDNNYLSRQEQQPAER